jgi:hypothetical protein
MEIYAFAIVCIQNSIQEFADPAGSREKKWEEEILLSTYRSHAGT